MLISKLKNLYNPHEKEEDFIMNKNKNLSRKKLPEIMKIFQETRRRRELIVILTAFSLIQLFSGQASLVVCQDYEDLNQQHHSNNKPMQHTFQPLNRQSQLATSMTPLSSSSSSTTTTTAARQRPLLSNRFAPASFGQQTTSLSSTINNNLNAQASSNSAVFSMPQQQPQQPISNGVSSIEQLMKNALARTAKFNSDAAPEPRQDFAAAPSIGAAAAAGGNEIERPAAASMAPVVGLRSSALQAATQQQQQQTLLPTSGSALLARGVDKQASVPETPLLQETKVVALSNVGPDQAAEVSSEDGDKLTTVAQSTTTNGHETVYSEQRFANLFARRNNFKKSKIQPTEQVKAKPTLPSFIKSLPDPKQFSANQQLSQQDSINSNTGLSSSNNNNNNPRFVTPSSSFASQRVTNQARLSLANQQATQKNKAIITSNSAASANQKRTNTLAATARPNNSSASLKASSLSSASSNLKPVSNVKPATAPAINNPFNRQQNNNDPANVIAMARKRLLANNALESAKLKQQQQQQNKAT